MSHLHWRTIALAALLATVLFGCSRCSRNDEALTDVIGPPVQTSTQMDQSTGTPLTERPRPGETVLIEELAIIYFDFDSETLDDDDIAQLEANAEWLRQNPDIDVLIEGHCDERGTDEYNYNLGERRANSVLGYLQSLGVPNGLYTRSYGETRPAREGNSEAAWSQNRRVQFSSYGN